MKNLDWLELKTDPSVISPLTEHDHRWANEFSVIAAAWTISQPIERPSPTQTECTDGHRHGLPCR